MRLIEIPHKVCDCTCMVNGLEDLYTAKTGTRVPDWFFFYMSGMAGFAYIKDRRATPQYMVNWGTRVKDQYSLLSELVGFKWQVVENRSFPFSFQRALQAIDQGQPVVLGALDMYHLPYFEKFYHRYHIPYHYVLMVGYDPEQQMILVHDCGRASVQAIPYSDVELAWNVNVPGLSRPNTLFLFEFDEKVAEVNHIAREALRKKSAFMLHPPAGMLGIKGMHKLARELPNWSKELDAVHLKSALNWLVEFTGSPPAPPARLYGFKNEGEDHSGLRRNFAHLLFQLSDSVAKEARPAWLKAAELLDRSAQTIQELNEQVVDFLLGKNHDLCSAGVLVEKSADLEERAYCLLTEPQLTSKANLRQV